MLWILFRMYIKEHNTILWKWQKIKRPDISWYTYYHVYDVSTDLFRAPNHFNDINVFCGDAEEECGLRQDAVGGVADWIAKIANSNKDKKFICILDQGEHAHMRDKPDNFVYYNRKFHQGKYNFYNSSRPPAPSKYDTKSKWFYCPMGRANWARTHVFNNLIKNQMDSLGYVSYLSTNYPNRNPDANEYDKTNIDNVQYNYRNLIPFNNFEKILLDNEQRLIGNWEIMQQCLFGISVETGAFARQTWYTERIYNMLAAGLIPIVISGYNSTAGLESLGFRVPDYTNWRLFDNMYSDVFITGHWNTGTFYDDVDKIAYIIKDLHSFINQNDLNEIYEDWYPNALYNHNHFLYTLPRLYEQEEQIIVRWLLYETGKQFDPKFYYLIDCNQ